MPLTANRVIDIGCGIGAIAIPTQKKA